MSGLRLDDFAQGHSLFSCPSRTVAISQARSDTSADRLQSGRSLDRLRKKTSKKAELMKISGSYEQRLSHVAKTYAVCKGLLDGERGFATGGSLGRNL